MLTTKTIATNYKLDIVDIQDFKSYYYDNKDKFSATALNNFLKAVDIPPKFFKEQPESTQDILLDNREYFVAERKKFVGKVIVVLKAEQEILNACRLGRSEAEEKYNALITLDKVENKFEHRSFVKEGYTSFIVSEDIKKGVQNHVLVIDFPLLLNKKLFIHKALYKLPDDTSPVPVNHIHYLNSIEVELGTDYKTIKEAVDDNLGFLQEGLVMGESKDILRETELVTLALTELSVIPKTIMNKVTKHINKNSKGTLTTLNVEEFVLDFEEELRKYKQVTSLRSVCGDSILNYLNSDTFKALEKELEIE